MTQMRLQWPIANDVEPGDGDMPEGVTHLIIAETNYLRELGLEVDPRVHVVLDGGQLVASVTIQTPTDWDQADTAALLTHLASA